MSRTLKFFAVLAASMLPIATISVTSPTAAVAASSPTPSVVPALGSWTPANGSLTLTPRTRIVVDGRDPASLSTAQILAADLRAARDWPAPVVPALAAAHPGDIVLRHDAGRPGRGHRRHRGRHLLRHAHDPAAAGVRRRAPGGQRRGRPGLPGARRGAVRLLHVLQRRLDRPADQGHGVPEAQLPAPGDQGPQHGLPEDQLLSYYTPAEIRHLVALAGRYHITVVPEINSPGHIDPYLQNYPDLQLVDKNGVADATRLDVTKPEAFAFYTGLIDEYLELFPGPYWHMGADEYMLGSAYANYPQLLAYAQAKYGPDAVAQDAYIDFVNRVDAYVQSKGRTLRIWNDGLSGVNTVPLNQDVIVEHWLGEPVTPQNLLDAGHTGMNASAAFYYIRGGSRPNSRRLYETNWSPTDFIDGTVASGQPGLSGAEMTIWPDNYGAETENTTQTNVFMPLRVLAQATWGSPHPTSDYAGFQALAESLGHAPGWGPAFVQPVAQGSYVVKSPRGAMTSPTTAMSQLTASRTPSTWTLQPTADGYYRLVSDATGLCADLRRGTPNRLGVVEQEGAPVTAETCTGRRTQEWQLEPVPGGYRIVNAITQEAAVVQAGNVEQQPRGVAVHDVWRVAS